MIFFIAAMNITHIELKEKLVKTDNLMVATKKELLATLKTLFKTDARAIMKLLKNTHF